MVLVQFEGASYMVVEDAGILLVCVQIVVPVGKELDFDLTVPLSSRDGPLAGIYTQHSALKLLLLALLVGNSEIQF